jgi:hypothetical protein
MVGELVRSPRCVHCLRVTESLTADHVFPTSWYPDTTSPTVQRWTVPSCPECNHALGQLEKDLLIRLVLCIDPKSDAVSGLASKALRSLGVDAEGLSETERSYRDKLKTKIRSELMAYADVAEKPGAIPGLGSQDRQPTEWAIPIPWAGLSIIAEKIARGCEYKLRDRFVENPYGIRTFVNSSDFMPLPLALHARTVNFGPGCNVRQVVAVEDPGVVRYWISVWNSLHLHIRIDLEGLLQNADKKLATVDGFAPRDVPRAMQIPSYLRAQR